MILETIPFDFDDDIITRTRCDKITRVHVYNWTDVSVVIGRGGKQDLELMKQNIIKDEITLYKRPGGGCSVVLDPGNLIISVALPLPGLAGIKSAFTALSRWLISALDHCGVPDVRQLGVSDLTIGNRKIGGSCVYRTKDLLYYSTTLLVNHEFGLVGRYLKHPPREPGYRAGRSHDRFMVSLKEMGLVNAPDRWQTDLEIELKKGINQLIEDTGCPQN